MRWTEINIDVDADDDEITTFKRRGFEDASVENFLEMSQLISCSETKP